MPKRKDEPVMLIADESFIATVNGVETPFRKGETRLMSDSPVLKGLEHLFKPISTDFLGVEGE